MMCVVVWSLLSQPSEAGGEARTTRDQDKRRKEHRGRVEYKGTGRCQWLRQVSRLREMMMYSNEVELVVMPCSWWRSLSQPSGAGGEGQVLRRARQVSPTFVVSSLAPGPGGLE